MVNLAGDDIEMFSEEEDATEDQYAQLEASILELGSSQRIRPVSRSEIGSQISEYHIKPKGKAQSVRTTELANVLNTKRKLSKLDKNIIGVTKKSKTLPKPLEKPVAEKVKRIVGYESAKKQLGRWEPVVTTNRVADHTVYPLNTPKMSMGDTQEYLKSYLTPQQKKFLDLMKEEMPEDEKKNDEEENDDFPLTLEEMIEKRKEMARLRARQSYKEAKAYRQSKIKSKKYHRIQKREKVKQQLKEFEVLQKINPEAALKKLEELEKSRAEERATLRHRSTGKWAKNLTVRAKYDKESRKALAEQLSISRDIAMKVKPDDDSSDGEEVEIDTSVLKTALDTAKDNPWSLEVSAEVNHFISDFKKYWKGKQRNGNEKVGEEFDHGNDKNVPTIVEESPKSTHISDLSTSSKEKLKTGCTGKWSVSTYLETKQPLRRKADNFDIDDAFYIADTKLATAISEKFNVLKDKIKPLPKGKRKKKKNVEQSSEPDLTMKRSRWHVERADVDQELIDTEREKDNLVPEKINSGINVGSVEEKKGKAVNVNIDPQQFLKVKPTVMKAPLAEDIAAGEDALDDEEQYQVIMEAFADDNVVAEFQEKKQEEAKNTQVEVVAQLPGWGSWGGTDMVSDNKRRQKRFMKIPDLPKRKDSEMPDVIINEEGNPALKKHMVKEVPFPFKSVSAFEASVRAPISREWVPEVALSDLIRPPVVTRQGTVIEPISEEVLLRNQKKPRKVYKGKKNSNKKIRK